VGQANSAEWRCLRRFAVGLILAYAVLVQSLADPLLRLRAGDGASLAGAIAILCASDHGANGEQPASPGQHGAHCLECCVLGCRPVLDAPPWRAAALLALENATRTAAPVEYHALHAASRHAAHRRVHQPRAPPFFA